MDVCEVDVVDITVCSSCKDVGHKNEEYKFCPNSLWSLEQERVRLREKEKQGIIDTWIRLKDKLSKFEEFIVTNNITADQLNLCGIERIGKEDEAKLDYILENTLFDLQCDIATVLYEEEEKIDDPDIEIGDYISHVSLATKKIYGIVGSNAGNFWHSQSYVFAVFGTEILMRLWRLAP